MRMRQPNMIAFAAAPGRRLLTAGSSRPTGSGERVRLVGLFFTKMDLPKVDPAIHSAAKANMYKTNDTLWHAIPTCMGATHLGV